MAHFAAFFLNYLLGSTAATAQGLPVVTRVLAAGSRLRLQHVVVTLGVVAGRRGSARVTSRLLALKLLGSGPAQVRFLLHGAAWRKPT